jgi:hypothetical protein
VLRYKQTVHTCECYTCERYTTVTCAAVKFNLSNASIMRSSNGVHSGPLVLAVAASALMSLLPVFTSRLHSSIQATM